ncbi:DUF1688-domain-containing protein [Testicularia cyperi]|uniref:DUF1688-domain-containing protein n=1 Tax=Testicularia cyperi TaxID=1882483 RepID=A0A317XRP1_9BASI|nr:DUF1688-domain-containing protein [Testicularia cyperi]
MSNTVPAEVAYLRTLPSIRERCSKIFAAAEDGKLTYFTYDPTKEAEVAEYCGKIITRDFGDNFASIPPHGRWRHFDVGDIPRVTTILSRWAGVKTGSSDSAVPSTSAAGQPVDPTEAARRLVDLFIVSVLLDAGAGTKWKYEEAKTGLSYGRSEGLAVASLDMFLQGRFFQPLSSYESEDGTIGSRERVNAAGLKNLSPEQLAMDMQVHPDANPMTGLEGRTNLLIKLGEAVESDSNGYFVGPAAAGIPASQRRPGNLVDYLATHPTTKVAADGVTEVSVPALWEVLIYGLAPIWPASRTNLMGVAMGDVWPNQILADLNQVELGHEKSMVPFHKLSQWMCYSLLEAMEKTLQWRFVDGEHQTGLPEYRNGGLYVDLGVLTPTRALLDASDPPADNAGIPNIPAEHPAIVEWRAMTVMLLDRTASQIRTAMNLQPHQLNLKQVLESATWKGGREIAKQLRPETGGPPINVISDGTVF